MLQYHLLLYKVRARGTGSPTVFVDIQAIKQENDLASHQESRNEPQNCFHHPTYQETSKAKLGAMPQLFSLPSHKEKKPITCNRTEKSTHHYPLQEIQKSPSLPQQHSSPSQTNQPIFTKKQINKTADKPPPPSLRWSSSDIHTHTESRRISSEPNQANKANPFLKAEKRRGGKQSRCGAGQGGDS